MMVNKTIGEIDVVDYVEEEDGSATLTVELDDAAKKHLIEYAIVDLIKKAVDDT